MQFRFFYDFLAFIAFFSVRFAFTAFRLALRPFSVHSPSSRAASRGSFVAPAKNTYIMRCFPLPLGNKVGCQCNFRTAAAAATVVHPDNNIAAGCADKNDWGNCKRQQEQKFINSNKAETASASPAAAAAANVNSLGI